HQAKAWAAKPRVLASSATPPPDATKAPHDRRATEWGGSASAFPREALVKLTSVSEALCVIPSSPQRPQSWPHSRSVAANNPAPPSPPMLRTRRFAQNRTRTAGAFATHVPEGFFIAGDANLS